MQQASQRSAILRLFMVTALVALAWPMGGYAAGSRGISMEARQPTSDDDLHLGTYRALIIGNNVYHDTGKRWHSLRTAVAGAHAVKELLEQRYDFTDISLVENGSRRDILLALADLGRRVQANDNVLLYYAGHGYLDEDTGQGYWVPVDAQGTDVTTFIRNSTVRDELNQIASRAKHTLLIADSCFSGSLLRTGVRGIAVDTGVERYYQKVAAKKSVQIIAAGGVEFVDDNYKDSGQSPFTYFLLNELTHNDRPLITVSELSTNVEKAVANNTDQVPESGVLHGAGDELGEFIFLNVDVRVSGVPKDKVKVKVNVITDEDVQPAPASAASPEAPARRRLIVPPIPMM